MTGAPSQAADTVEILTDNRKNVLCLMNALNRMVNANLRTIHSEQKSYTHDNDELGNTSRFFF